MMTMPKTEARSDVAWFHLSCGSTMSCGTIGYDLCGFWMSRNDDKDLSIMALLLVLIAVDVSGVIL